MMGKKKIPSLDEETLFEMGKAEQVQKSQLFDLAGEIEEISSGMDQLDELVLSNYGTGKQLIAELENLLESGTAKGKTDAGKSDILKALDEYEMSCTVDSSSDVYDIKRTREILTHNSWEEYYQNINDYSEEIGINDSEDPFLLLLSENEYEVLADEVDGEFARKTSIKNKTDLKFLAVAVALEVAKGLLYPVLAQKAGYGQSFDPKNRLAHNDKTIQKAHKDATDAFNDKHKKDKGTGKWIEFLGRPVPFDTTVGTGKMTDINLHGGEHRLYTLGHDPVLGWIFGTADILSDVITIAPGAITPKQEDLKALEKLFKVVTMRSYRVERQPELRVTPVRVSLPILFQESSEVANEHPINLPAAVFTEWQHLKSDKFTKMGLPVPGLETFSPDFASKLYKNNYDALCFARDLKIIGSSAVISILIDTIIGLVHGLKFDPQKDGTRDLFEVRTRKILLIANTIGTSSNLIMTAVTKNPKALDIGGLLVTVSHLFMDTRFFTNVKKEFIENRIYEKIDAEIKELDRIEEELMQYGYQHRDLY